MHNKSQRLQQIYFITYFVIITTFWRIALQFYNECLQFKNISTTRIVGRIVQMYTDLKTKAFFFKYLFKFIIINNNNNNNNNK